MNSHDKEILALHEKLILLAWDEISNMALNSDVSVGDPWGFAQEVLEEYLKRADMEPQNRGHLLEAVYNEKIAEIQAEIEAAAREHPRYVEMGREAGKQIWKIRCSKEVRLITMNTLEILPWDKSSKIRATEIARAFVESAREAYVEKFGEAPEKSLFPSSDQDRDLLREWFYDSIGCMEKPEDLIEWAREFIAQTKEIVPRLKREHGKDWKEYY